MRTICDAILDEEPGFFSDLPYYGSISDEKTRRSEILDYAENCGIYHRFGLLKMNITRPMESRQLFADEDRIFPDTMILPPVPPQGSSPISPSVIGDGTTATRVSRITTTVSHPNTGR